MEHTPLVDLVDKVAQLEAKVKALESKVSWLEAWSRRVGTMHTS